MKRKPKRHDKPGPQEERLIITENPEAALKRLIEPKKAEHAQKSGNAGRTERSE